MYVPKHQYTKKTLLNTEARAQYENGTPYTKATYIELSNGDAYDVPEADLQNGNFRNAKKLILDSVSQYAGTALLLAKSIVLKIKPGQKTVPRYFIRHKVAKQVIEVSEDDYNTEVANLAPYKQALQLTWTVAGPVEDYQVNGYLYEGVKTKNRKAVEEAQKQMPELPQYITDYAYLAQDVDKFEPAPQTSSISFDIPSPA
jgi:hypothetical protein